MDPRAERSRAAGLAAAREVLLHEGWNAVTHDRIAQRGGISRATVYRRWPTRAALLTEILGTEAMSMHAELSGNLRDDLIGELRRFVTVVAQPGWNQVFAAFVHYASTDPDIRPVMDGLAAYNLGFMTRAVENALRDGELAADTDPERATAQLMGPMIYSFLISGRPPTNDFIESIVDEFLRAHIAQREPAETRR